MRLKDCFRKGLLRRVQKNREIAEKTIQMAENDLSEAESSYAKESYVWAMVQVYTSMLNFSRAILFSDGIREKSHVCTVEYLRVKHRKHYGDLIEKLDVLRRERHLTLYDSREHITARKVKERIGWCKEFQKKTRELLKVK